MSDQSKSFDTAYPVIAIETGWMQGSISGGDKIEDRLYLELTFETLQGPKEATFVFDKPESAKRTAFALNSSVEKGPQGLTTEDRD